MRWLMLMGVLCLEAQGSYRVYQLRVTEYDYRGRPLKTRSVLSNIDPYQWEHTYSSYRWSRVEMVDTWYCPGDTSRRGYCTKPKVAPTRGPASTVGTRVPLSYQPVIP